MQISTGVIATNRSKQWVEAELRSRAANHGMDIDPDTIVISIPRPGMKVAVAEMVKKEKK